MGWAPLHAHGGWPTRGRGCRSAWRSPSTALERDRDARESSVAEVRDQLRAADRPGAQLMQREAA
jgi:hypothetical protein